MNPTLSAKNSKTGRQWVRKSGWKFSCVPVSLLLLTYFCSIRFEFPPSFPTKVRKRKRKTLFLFVFLFLNFWLKNFHQIYSQVRTPHVGQGLYLSMLGGGLIPAFRCRSGIGFPFRYPIYFVLVMQNAIIFKFGCFCNVFFMRADRLGILFILMHLIRQKMYPYLKSILCLPLLLHLWSMRMQSTSIKCFTSWPAVCDEFTITVNKQVRVFLIFFKQENLFFFTPNQIAESGFSVVLLTWSQFVCLGQKHFGNIVYSHRS